MYPYSSTCVPIRLNGRARIRLVVDDEPEPAASLGRLRLVPVVRERDLERLLGERLALLVVHVDHVVLEGAARNRARLTDD